MSYVKDTIAMRNLDKMKVRARATSSNHRIITTAQDYAEYLDTSIKFMEASYEQQCKMVKALENLAAPKTPQWTGGPR